jgi:CrcB protein
VGTAIAVGLGGAVGALLRYGLVSLVHARTTSPFPWGTLAVNLLGAFLLGVVYAALDRGHLPQELQAHLAVGLLGSFTTFSTFSLDALRLLESGAWLRAGAYLLGSVGLGLAFVYLGIRLVGRGPA